MADRVAIIGGGHGAVQAASQLRTLGFAGEIFLFSNEAALPYQRPPLSKGFLAGAMKAERLVFRNQNFYQENNIKLHLDERVEGIDRQAHRLQTQKNTYAYDRLIIATGGSPRPLPFAQGKGLYLNNQKTCLGLQKILATSKNMAIIGGGYIGLEVAATARKMGVEVEVFESAPRILSRVAAEEISNFFTSYHKQQGVSFALDAKADETIFNFDAVLVGIGMLPNIALAEAAGLKTDGGIIVNDKQETEDESIYAIGDCALAPHPLYDGLIRLESVQNANYHAARVARAICGAAPPAVEAPWFWSDQYDIKLQIAGLSRGYDRIIVRGEPAKASFALFYIAKDKVIAVDCINRPHEFLLTKKALSARQEIKLDKLADDNLPVKEIF